MPPKVQIEFVRAEDDTDENREIVHIAEERSGVPRSHDRDLDQLIQDCGYSPEMFTLQRD